MCVFCQDVVCMGWFMQCVLVTTLDVELALFNHDRRCSEEHLRPPHTVTPLLNVGRKQHASGSRRISKCEKCNRAQQLADKGVNRRYIALAFWFLASNMAVLRDRAPPYEDKKCQRQPTPPFAQSSN